MKIDTINIPVLSKSLQLYYFVCKERGSSLHWEVFSIVDTNSEDVKLKNLECGVQNVQSSLYFEGIFGQRIWALQYPQKFLVWFV